MSKIHQKYSKTATMAALLLSSFIFYQAFVPEPPTPPGGGAGPTSYLVPVSYIVPKDIYVPADSVAAARFAWQEFIALTWPAKPNPDPTSSGYFRCQPDTRAKYGSERPGTPVVWETYYHRDELYPNYPDAQQHTLPGPDTIPNYYYGTNSITKATPSTSQNLFNNLDEASEISIANMYFTPLAMKADSVANTNPSPTMLAHAQVKAGIMYEAKGNSVIYGYVNHNGLNNSSKRTPALKAARKKIQNKFSDTTGNFNLPYGSIEIKASWRRYNAGVDNLKQFHWSVGMYYTMNAQNQLVVHNDTILLVGLHIIQKTPNVPTFVFATFEHVSNEQNGFRFTNAFPQTAKFTDPTIRPLPDPGVITAKRQFPIPGYIAALNSQMHGQLKNTVWANYQLIGVQAVVANNPTAQVPPQQFFLSNFATETNNTLQFFQGGLFGPASNVPDPSLAHVFKYNKDSLKYIAYTAGGCLGCHGSQGQFAGGDFSVIAATGNSFVPQPVTPYPTGSSTVQQNPTSFPLPKGLTIKGKTTYTINNYADVQALLDVFVDTNQLTPQQAPHHTFWRKLSYSQFINDSIHTGYGKAKILQIGDSASSNIIKVLRGTSHQYPAMPPGGPYNKYFPRQDSIINRLSIWIQNGCPNPTN